jgi:hypothetical protein
MHTRPAGGLNPAGRMTGMTSIEKSGAKKAFDEAMCNVRESASDWSKYERAKRVGDPIATEIHQRNNDIHRGYALGIAQALTLVGSGELARKIHIELGE